MSSAAGGAANLSPLRSTGRGGGGKYSNRKSKSVVMCFVYCCIFALLLIVVLKLVHFNSNFFVGNNTSPHTKHRSPYANSHPTPLTNNITGRGRGDVDVDSAEYSSHFSNTCSL